MTSITNDAEFRQALDHLDAAAQRHVAVDFVKHVLPLSGDSRVARALETAAAADATEEELSAALKSVRQAVIDSHTRCGSEGDWSEQAGYFVARAAAAALGGGKSGGPAWNAAVNCRMARTCQSIDTEPDASGRESAAQYAILAENLN